MASELLSCEACGAGLSVTPGTRFVTCTRCHTRLAVRRTESALYTELLPSEAPSSRVASADPSPLLEVLRLQNELLRVDQEWALKRDLMLVYGRDGYPSEPDVAAVVQSLGAILALIFAGYWLFPWRDGVLDGTRTLVLAAVALVVSFVVLANYIRVKGYWLARARYEKRRAALREQLAEVEELCGTA